MERLKEYQLFAPSRTFCVLWNRPPGEWREQWQQYYRVTVRAHSIRQAYYLAANRVQADDGPGIVEVDEPQSEEA